MFPPRREPSDPGSLLEADAWSQRVMTPRRKQRHTALSRPSRAADKGAQKRARKAQRRTQGRR